MMNKNLYREALNDIKVDEKFIRGLSIKMEKKIKGSKPTGKYGVMAAGLAVLMLAAVFTQGRFNLFPEKKIIQLNAGESITLSDGKGNININKIDNIISSKLLIPEDAYSKDYTMSMLAEFFGKNPLPKIPEGFKASADSTVITFGPDGKMLFMSPLQFSKDINDPDAPSIDIRLNKGSLPPKDCIYSSQPKESIIGETKVVIGTSKIEGKLDEQGKPAESFNVYSAEFIHDGIGYNITAKRTDAQTFLDLLESILVRPKR